MRRIAFAALLVVSWGIADVGAAEPIIVNGKEIKQSLVDYILKDAVAHGQPVDDKMRASIVDKLIMGELIDQEAQKAGIDKQPDFLAKAELALRELRVNAYLEDFIKRNPVSDKDLQSEYDKLKAQYSGKEYKAGHILVKTEDEAKGIVGQLSKGASFAQLAKEQSLDTGSKENGGELGWFSPAAMVKPFGDAVAKLEKGRYTVTPVQTEFGWHVILLEDSRDTIPPAFDSVKNELRNDMQRRQLEKMVGDLRAQAKIENNMAK